MKEQKNMGRLIRWLWFGDGHKHIWEYESTTMHYTNAFTPDKYIGKTYNYICKTCKKHKHEKIK